MNQIWPTVNPRSKYMTATRHRISDEILRCMEIYKLTSYEVLSILAQESVVYANLGITEEREAKCSSSPS